MKLGTGVSIPERSVPGQGSAAQTPAPSCSVTLSGAIGPAFGVAAADVSGQTFSVTGASANVYLASTPFATAGVRRAMPAAGKKVWVEMGGFSMSASDVNARGGFIGFDGSGNPVVTAVFRKYQDGYNDLYFEAPAGTSLATMSLPQGNVSYLSLGVGQDGELYFYRADTAAVVSAGSLNPAVAGAFSGVATLALLGVLDLLGAAGARDASGTFTTSQGSMADAAALTGDEDWCGNAIE